MAATHGVAASGQGAARREREGEGPLQRVGRLPQRAPETRVPHGPLPSPAAKTPDSESLLARGCSHGKRLWIGTTFSPPSVNT